MNPDAEVLPQNRYYRVTTKAGEKGGSNTFYMTDVTVPGGTPIPAR